MSRLVSWGNHLNYWANYYQTFYEIPKWFGGWLYDDFFPVLKLFHILIIVQSVNDNQSSSNATNLTSIIHSRTIFAIYYLDGKQNFANKCAVRTAGPSWFYSNCIKLCRSIRKPIKITFTTFIFQMFVDDQETCRFDPVRSSLND